MTQDIRHRLGMTVACSLAAALLLAGCGESGESSGGAAAAAGGVAPEVGIVVVKEGSATLKTELPGRVTPYRIAEVRPQVGGIIQERKFEEGGQIHSGQVLYQIDPAVYQASYDSAKASLARSRATLERARLKAERYANLLKTDSISQDDYDDANAALKEAIADVAVDEADLQQAKINLDYTKVTSPIDGRVGRSMMTQGALVTANQEQELATVQQLNPIYVDLTQSSSQLLKLRRALEDGSLKRPDGAPKVTLLLEDGTTFDKVGRLDFAEVTVDKSTGAVTMRATMPNPDDVLLPGMFVRAVVDEGVRPNAIVVPQQGVTHDRQGHSVALLVKDDGTVEQRILKVNRSIGNDWLVDDGLKPGDKLIVEGSLKVRPGVKVTVKDLSDDPKFASAAAQKSE